MLTYIVRAVDELGNWTRPVIAESAEKAVAAHARRSRDFPHVFVDDGDHPITLHQLQQLVREEAAERS
jgi:hypothetical protein